jgi:hypothetical protein
MSSAWLSGLVVGVGAGFLALEVPAVGWLIAVVFVLGALLSRRRIAAIGGELTALGGTWVLLFRIAADTCREGCEAPDVSGWLVAAWVLAAIGAFLTVVAADRSRRP